MEWFYTGYIISETTDGFRTLRGFKIINSWEDKLYKITQLKLWGYRMSLENVEMLENDVSEYLRQKMRL